MTLTRNTLEKRVKRGAHLLDRKEPNWYESIDLPHLDMENGEACILGQTDGYYSAHAVKLGLLKYEGQENEAKAIAHGFALEQAEWERKRNVSALTELWAFEVARRLIRK